MDADQRKGLAILKSEAKRLGKTFEDFLNTDLRTILEKLWEIQQRTGKPVSIDQLYRELYPRDNAPGPSPGADGGRE